VVISRLLRWCRRAILPVNTIKEADDCVGGFSCEERLNRLHHRAGAARSVRSETATVAQLAYSLNRGAQTVQCSRQAIARFCLPARRRGKERQMTSSCLEQLGNVVVFAVVNLAFPKNRPTCTFDERPR